MTRDLNLTQENKDFLASELAGEFFMKEVLAQGIKASKDEEEHLRDAEGYLVRDIDGNPVKVFDDLGLDKDAETLLEKLTEECEAHVDTIEDHLKTIHELRTEMSDMRCTIAFLCGLLGTSHSSEVEHIGRTYCNLNFNSRKKG